MKNFGMQIQLFAAIGLIVSLSACSPISENGLLTGELTQPSSHLLDMTPKDEELYIRSDAATVYNLAGQNRADISGECYASTFPSHAIYVLRNESPVTIFDVTPSGNISSNAATCHQGRFNISVDTTGFAASTALKVQIRGIDSQGGIHRNLGRGTGSFTLTK